MATARRKYRTSLLVMVLLVLGIWSGIAAGSECNEVTQPAPTTSPTPGSTASPTPTAIASPKSTASPSASPSPSPSATPSASTKNVCKHPWKPKLGLDLQGGISVVLTAKGNASSGSIDKAVDIIRLRVDSLGVAEPDISRQGNNILVQLPGLKDPSKAIKLIGTTAQLRFRPVLAAIQPGSPEYALPPDCSDSNTWPQDDPTKEIILCARDKDPNTGQDKDESVWPKLRLGPEALGGTDVKTARAQLPPAQSGGFQWEVNLSLTGDGAKKFATITGQLACNTSGDPKRQLAIVLDRVVETHPQMGDQVECRKGISGGNAQITGQFTEAEARDLELILKYGALPVAFEPSTTTTVSPTLGKDSLRSGLIAGAIGLVIVFVYVLLFYRGLGMLVWIGVAMHAAFTLGVVIILGHTAGFALTLAGIAGLIVSLGIATDSFIVYFERIKDEVHQGKTVRASVDRAWQSAWRTIINADLVTALAAFVLYFLAVGSVRGFALMLGLATGLDLFVSYLFMHPSVWLLAQTKVFNSSKTFGIGRVVGETAAAPAPSGGAR
jgi:preprotein translocase subunit SecD